MFSVIITKQSLDRLLWLFDDTKARLPYAGRKFTRLPDEVVRQQQPDLQIPEEGVQVAFGRYHRAVRTTNGATYDMEVSCPTMRLSHTELVFLQVVKGGHDHHYHFIATPANFEKEGRELTKCFDMQMIRKDMCISLQFTTGDRPPHEFKIFKKDFATGSGRGVSPKDLYWSDEDRYRYDLIVTWDEDSQRQITQNFRTEFLEKRTEDKPFQNIKFEEGLPSRRAARTGGGERR